VVTAFSPRTIRCLTSAGWTNGRSIDVTDITKELENDGFLLSEAAADFLSAFGGLRLSYPHFRDPTIPYYCSFDAVRAAKGVFHQRLLQWESRVGNRITPIGEADREYMTLLMTPNGSVYEAMDDSLLHLGDSGEEAIDALCCQWPMGSAQGRPGEVPAGGHENCPPADTRSAWVLGQWCHPFAAGGLLEPHAVAGGDAEVSVVEEPVDGGPGEGFGHELVEAGWVQIG
jgi:hypothetical protein